MSPNFKRILVNSLRLYFAPLTGAYRGVCYELARIDRERQQMSDIKIPKTK